MYQYQGGIVKQYFDVLGAHNEPYWNPPDQTVATATHTSYANDPSFFFRQVEDYHNLMVNSGDGNKQIWETEIGYDANTMAPAGYSGWTVSDQDQANLLVALFQYARAHYPWMGAIFVWNLNFQAVVPQTDEKWGFGVLNPDFTARPAYNALVGMAKT
jgi:polysaccharide biosynthesis protein PslG